MSSYLRRRKNVFHFRINVPNDLVCIIGVKELVRSTKTGDYQLAKKVSRRMLVKVDTLFETARKIEYMKIPEIENLARAYYLKYSDNMERKLAEHPERDNWEELLNTVIAGDKILLQQDNYETIERALDGFIQDQRVKLPTDPVELKLLKRYLFRAHIAVAESTLAHHKADYGFKPSDTLFSNVIENRSTVVESYSSPSDPNIAVSKTPNYLKNFSEYIGPFTDFMKNSGEWTNKTHWNYTKTYLRFIEVCGDKPIDTYDKSDVVKFLDTLRKVNSNYGKSPADKNKTLEEIIIAAEGKNLKTLSERTIRKHKTAISSFFTYLENQGIFEGKNPTSGIQLSKRKLAEKNRDLWSDAYLISLFKSPVWSGNKTITARKKSGNKIFKDAYYWLPLLALYQGARQEELAQLKRVDIQVDNGISFINIHEGEGYKLKNSQSARKIPIHPFIIELGFIDYIEKETSSPSDQIFPRLKRTGPDQKFSEYYTKWFSNYKKYFGLNDPRIVFHSFRNTFISNLLNKGVSKEIVTALVGHDDGGGTTTKVYFKGFTLKNLHEAISKLSFPEVEKLFCKRRCKTSPLRR